jgi:hypothetical protein
MGMTSTASEQTRAEDSVFISQCSLLSLQTNLPLKWPTPPHSFFAKEKLPLGLCLPLAGGIIRPGPSFDLEKSV